MSKKKTFSGSTMTLKDFHGGSIPSDLPLPSAPGVVAKVPDRGVSERQSTGSNWGTPRGYSAGGRQGFGNNPQRGFEDKVSYIPNSANIGRNFDEDERKPLDSFPRRGSVNEEDYQDKTFDERRYRSGDRISSGRSEVKSESAGFGMARQQHHDLGLIGNQDRGLGQYSQQQTVFGSQFAAPLPKHLSSTGRPVSSGVVQHIGPGPAVVPNAWGIRKDMDPSSVNENISSSQWCAESVASRFAQASAVDKVSSGRWQSKLSLGFEQQSDRFPQTQHLDSGKVGIDSGNLSYGFGETEYIGRQGRIPGSVDQSSFIERDKYAFDDFRGNSYGDSRKGFSVELGKPDAAKDIPTEAARNHAIDSLPAFAETARASFGELSQVRIGHNAEYSGNVDPSWNKTESNADLDRNEMISIGKTTPRQMSPVMDHTDGKNCNIHPKDWASPSSQVVNSFEGSGPYYSTRSAQSLGNSRDSLISEGGRNIFPSDYKLSGKAAQNLGNEANRNRFVAEDVHVSSPLAVHRPHSAENNLAPATAVTVSSVHVTSDSSGRPKLKLLPRSKPLEPTSEIEAVEHIEIAHGGLMSKSYDYHAASSPSTVEGVGKAGNITRPTVKALGTSDIEEETRRSERPKLNLKPRSLPVEQLDAILEKERKSLFGGARPRELVLKERGVDDMVINGLDPVPVGNIGKGSKMNSKDTNQLDEKVEQIGESMGSGSNIRQGDKFENIFDRKGNNRPSERLDTSRSERRDPDKQELQRNVRRNENWRNPQNNYKQERRDPDKQESWRKSVDSPGSNSGLQKSNSSSLLDPANNVPGKYGHGRAASAMELAEAFSSQRSPLTNPSSNDASGRKALPFSRLTDSSVAREVYSSSAHRQINGY